MIAVLASDIHLSHNPPIARACEPDWYAAMRRPLDEVRDLCSTHKCSFIIAGDIFHKWNTPAELINFAIANLPRDTYAIPGQHDLPHHRYDDIYKSAYWTLVESNVIKNIYPSKPWTTRNIIANKLMVYGFPWGFEVTPLEEPDPDYLHLAVIHRYVWKGDAKYHGAPQSQNNNALIPQLKGYTNAVVGDNHKPFFFGDKSQFMNCGGFIRRTVDELTHTPRVGLLHDDGTITPHFLNLSGEKMSAAHLKKGDPEITEKDLQELLNEFSDLAAESVDFLQRLNDLLRGGNVTAGVERVIRESMERIAK